MKNIFGTSISVTLFGESHGEAIGAVVDGLPAGIKIDTDFIDKKLAERRPHGNLSTSRVEKDNYRIVSGAFCGYTTGTPLTFIIENENTVSKNYDLIKDVPRPGHADYTAECKYHGYQDYRGGGHFSGRITAALVAVGALLLPALEAKNIKIGSHIAALHGIADRCFENYEDDLAILAKKDFPALSDEAEKKMKNEILSAKSSCDSVGGILESVILGIPKGLGEPWFDSMESMISHILFSIGGIKGVEFGDGFAMANMLGSEANDAFEMKDGEVVTKTNRNGGINGGITNGMPIILHCAVKPTPSIFKEQDSVNLKTGENQTIKIEGRHDPAIIHRVKSVVDSALAIVIADMLSQRFGTDYLTTK